MTHPAIEMDRSQKLLFRVDKSMKILEFGPSFGPIAPKADGWNAWSLDHADAESLRQKYATAADVDTSRIETVDFVCPGGDFNATIPAEHRGTFDCCIASHVIEHFPNPLQFFRAMMEILKPGGIISLAVPDKRFCFDCFKPLSTTADILYAHTQGRRRHTKKTAFEHLAYNALVDGKGGWGPHPISEVSLAHSIEDAKRHFDDTEETEAGPYVDFHAWYFTPSSFRLILLELNALGLLDWMIDADFSGAGSEFFVTLKRGRLTFQSDAAREAQRLALLKGILGELADQHRYVSQAPEESTPANAAAEAEPQPEVTAPRPKRVKWRKRLKRMARSVLPRHA